MKIKLYVDMLSPVRTYNQYCAVAKALDVVGDRWSLLIVRELALQGPCRYTDLRAGLPGIATNLLAQRLRDLEQAGVLRREAAPPPVATTLFSLTDEGRGLEPVLTALGRWGQGFMTRPDGSEEFRSHWLAFPAAELLTDTEPDAQPVSIELRTGDRPVTLDTAEGELRIRLEPPADPDLVLDGPPWLILGLLSRKLSLAEARTRGLETSGDVKVLGRVAPSAGSAG